MRKISAADLIWISVASLTREQPDQSGFSHDEILKTVHELMPNHGFKLSTIRTHITSHCVANKKPDPGKHRKLFLNADGTYRLYRPGDEYHAGRKDGKLLPDVNRIPKEYCDLLDWYHAKHLRTRKAVESDPILALRGLGKEHLLRMGGGEKFLRDLRSGWDERSLAIEASKPVRRKKAV